MTSLMVDAFNVLRYYIDVYLRKDTLRPYHREYASVNLVHTLKLDEVPKIGFTRMSQMVTSQTNLLMEK